MAAHEEHPRHDAAQHDLAPPHSRRSEAEPPNAVAAVADAVRRCPDAPLIRYFDATITTTELDELTDAFAAALQDRGVVPGERVALYLQSTPQFAIALLGAWKAGCTAVPVNPMNKRRELALLLADSGAAVLVALRGLHESVAAEVLPDTAVRLVITTAERAFQGRDDARVLPEPDGPVPAGTTDLGELLAAHRGRRPEPVEPGPEDVAALSYTSGTTGPPKGAMNTHRNVVFDARVWRDLAGLGADGSVLGVAPLFHITGLVGHVALALLTPVPLVLTHRFEPEVVLDAIREHRPTFAVGAITAFIALLGTEGTAADLASLRRVYSGGAPIPPSTVRDFERRFGQRIHNVYGLTETTSAAFAQPWGVAGRVDVASGALSVGVPVGSTRARVLGEDGRAVPPGEIGELAISGPQVVPGYWGRPAETEAALPGGELRTGDVAHRDADGWFYLVDRKKDQINAGGYKVWPREVEDVLYEHPAVREAAVVGVPDPYRGETVRAYVSLRAGQRADPAELVEFCRARLAAYKYPRQVEVLPELPKTATGKLLRRALRDR
ncbi:class I adenylate-forming enzyme family protein [Saccharopolyspora sp. 6M]|uniref:class I adenylate-forming enzyme family protein n=1 Tax=Saccharopolyspora sp. 6M TaxID=2877237 RepID=UPI001CD2F986|nr:AMP-binding protein [Saccharopolyspora sp. 6M]MCA1227583.1 AMP-binding protein [Saccharopolyspora sp. 6M]